MMKMMRKWLLINCVLLLFIASYSKADQALIDSLEDLLHAVSAVEQPDKVAGRDTIEVNLLNRLSLEYLTEDALTAYRYANRGLALAEKTMYDEGISAVYDNLGNIYKSLGDYITALEYFTKSVKVKNKVLTTAKSNRDSEKIWTVKRGVADMYYDIAALYELLGDYRGALDYFFRSLMLRSELMEQVTISENAEPSADVENSLIYTVSQDFVTCKKNIGIIYLKQAAISLEKGDTAEANLHSSTAMRLFVENLRINQEVLAKVDKYGAAHSYNNIGLVHYSKGDLSLEKEDSAQAMRDYSSALKNHIEGLTIFKEVGDAPGIVDSYINIGLVYTRFGKYADAAEYFSMGLDIAEKATLDRRRETVYGELATTYRALGDYENAYLYHKLYLGVNEILINEERGAELHCLEIKRIFELDNMNKKASTEAQAVAEKKELEGFDFLGETGSMILIVLSFVAVFIFHRLLIPVRIARSIIFFGIIFIYIFIMALTGPYIETYSGGDDGFRFFIIALEAALLFPLYQLCIKYINQGKVI